MNKFCFFLLILFSSFSFAENTPKDLVKLSLGVINIQGKPGYLALNFENKKKWHTYWINPGDAGLAIKNEFSTELKELERPMPQRYIEPGDMWAYGYEGEYSLFYELPSTLTLIKNTN